MGLLNLLGLGLGFFAGILLLGLLVFAGLSEGMM